MAIAAIRVNTNTLVCEARRQGFDDVLFDPSDDEIMPARPPPSIVGLQRRDCRSARKIGVRADIIKTVREANRENDAGDIDAEIADIILQAGIFESYIYG